EPLPTVRQTTSSWHASQSGAPLPWASSAKMWETRRALGEVVVMVSLASGASGPVKGDEEEHEPVGEHDGGDRDRQDDGRGDPVGAGRAVDRADREMEVDRAGGEVRDAQHVVDLR